MDLASRLLELEQRFESYCNLHAQEIAEIRQNLHDLRVELLRASPGSAGSPPKQDGLDFSAARPGDNGLAAGSETTDELSI